MATVIEPEAPFAPFAAMAAGDHEEIVFWRDRVTGLRAIVAIHDTTVGPVLGGTRMFPYPSEAAAVEDALRLSGAMTLKSVAAGLDVGGGKAVIIGDPTTDKSEEMRGHSAERASARAEQVYETTRRIFALARASRVTTEEAAVCYAQERTRTIGDLHRTYLASHRYQVRRA